MMKWIATAFGVLILCGAPAPAATLDLGTWYQFQFDGSLGEVEPCVICDLLFPPVQPAPAKPWDLVAPPGGAIITVTDAFDRFERFEVFVDGTSLGETSPPAGGGNCGSDIGICLADPDTSSGKFIVAPGDYVLRIVQTEGFDGVGAFRVDAIPEPGAMILIGSGLAALLLSKRFRRACRTRGT
jgi:hypothetical protein